MVSFFPPPPHLFLPDSPKTGLVFLFISAIILLAAESAAAEPILQGKERKVMISVAVEIVLQVLRIIGRCFLFRKCNIKAIWSIVPIANNYKLAQCADDEDSGAVWCIAHSLFGFFVFAESLLTVTGYTQGTAYLTSMILVIVFGIIDIIYSIRIYSELCDEFRRKKGWILCWYFLEPVTLLLWGISKRFQPNTVVLTESNDLSGRTAEKLAEGLTININKRTDRKGLFSTKTMLRDIHLNITPGKMVLLLGGSGAGKTTFINAVTGYEKADASISLNGNDVYKDFHKVIYDIGVVPQQELIRTTDTVYRTLMDAAALRMPSNVGFLERKKRVNEVMKMFGLAPIKNNVIRKQSGGQKKRISIAMEYISDPSLFILDEPDSGLDGILARELMQKLHNISREGKIVMVVTHTPDRVIDLFDDVIVLAKDERRTGRLVFHGAVSDAKKFFEADSMEQIVKTINRPDEGGLGRADELVRKFNEMRKAVS